MHPFYRALYDYEAQDESTLPFRTGDIIEVLTQQPSGWWYGLFGGKQGWFPSKYMTVISDEKPGLAFPPAKRSAVDGQAQGSQASALRGSRSNVQSDYGERFDNDGRYQEENHNGNQPSDVWIAEGTTPDGQIYYVNTQTGQRSTNLPEAAEEDDISDGDLASLTSQTTFWSGTSSGLPYNYDEHTEVSSDSEDALTSNGTSDHWVKKLADDGVSHFYFNTVDGKVQWTTPEGASNRTSSVRTRVPLSANARRPDSSRLSVYSDDSDVDPFDDLPASRLRQKNRSSRPMAHSSFISEVNQTALMELASAERIAKELQQSLEPPPPSLITDFAALSKIAIHAVIESVQLGGVIRQPEDDAKMDQLICNVVLAIRNLLYIGAAPTSEVPCAILPGGGHKRTHSYPPLKPAQKKVTATLSKLVLNARALQNDSGSQLADTLNRIEMDSEELEKDVLSFVLEVQNDEHDQPKSDIKPKRLEGVFTTANVGLGLVGAGIAGSWKGFGYVSVDDDAGMPQKPLGAEAISDISLSLLRLQDEVNSLKQTLRIGTDNALQLLRSKVQELIAQISAFLNLVADIHVARHVDIEGIRLAGGAVGNNHYSHSVESARRFVRILESVVQVIYDDSSALLLATQSLHDGDGASQKIAMFDRIDKLSSSLSSNFDAVKQTFQGLLSVGQEQADIVQGVRKKSAENDSLYDSYKPVANSSETAVAPTLDSEVDVSPSLKPMSLSSVENKSQRSLSDEYADEVAADVRPWYLRPNYSPSDIIIDPKNGSVRGGMVPALVEHLTTHEQADATFSKAFLMTYKSFTTLNELFDLLVSRFRIQPPDDLTPAEREEWGKLKQHVIQMRVINIMKSMVVDDGVLDNGDRYILDRMKTFISADEVSRFAAGKHLLNQIEKAQRQGQAVKTSVNTTSGSPPPPIFPKSNKKLKLLDIDPLELARQLTIMESQLYQKIKPIECLLRSREEKTENVDNITIIMQTSNRIADWVTESVLSNEDCRKRAQVFKHFISVADHCRTLNNFSTMSAITSGLNTSPIRRLKRTREQINRHFMSLFAACEMTIESYKTFTKYRSIMASVTPPCVPFIGVFLSTLQFIEDGNPDNLEGGLVNFRKRKLASEVINDIKRWQAQPFNLQPLAPVSVFINDSLSQYSDTRASREHFWTLSHQREPKKEG